MIAFSLEEDPLTSHEIPVLHPKPLREPTGPYLGFAGSVGGSLLSWDPMIESSGAGVLQFSSLEATKGRPGSPGVEIRRRPAGR